MLQRLAALESRTDAILRGDELGADAEGKLDIAELCRVKRRFATRRGST